VHICSFYLKCIFDIFENIKKFKLKLMFTSPCPMCPQSGFGERDFYVAYKKAKLGIKISLF
jgi:hypothetical protein